MRESEYQEPFRTELDARGEPVDSLPPSRFDPLTGAEAEVGSDVWIKRKSWFGKRYGETKTYWHGSSYHHSSDGRQDDAVLIPGEGEIYCAEAENSPSSIRLSKSKSNQITRNCKIVGTFNYDVAYETLCGWLDLNNLWEDFPTPKSPALPLEDKQLTIDSGGAPIWEATLEYYDKENSGKNNYEIQISTLGGTATISTARSTVQRVSCLLGEPQEETYGLLNVNDDGVAEGVEVKRPNMQMTIVEKIGWSKFTFQRFLKLLDHTPCVNSEYFCGFAPGSILYEGCDVDLLNEDDEENGEIKLKWKLSHKFQWAMNVVGQTEAIWTWQGEKTALESEPYNKNGWDYKWSKFVNIIKDGEVKKVLRQVNVERLYVYADFQELKLPEFHFASEE
ncbi:MAG: hypothetical protein IJO40_04255 [Thermoguttaceae bacterium]|nr:hypothetical protein [Thermoguttaceae bacterium]